jgi:hypothetical protein
VHHRLAELGNYANASFLEALASNGVIQRLTIIAAQVMAFQTIRVTCWECKQIKISIFHIQLKKKYRYVAILIF